MPCLQVGLLDRLLKIVPPSLSRFFFANSGSEAVDNAIKVARAHTKRQNIICFEVAPNCIPSYELQDPGTTFNFACMLPCCALLSWGLLLCSALTLTALPQYA